MAKKKKAPEAKAPLRGLLDTPTNCNSYIVHDPDHELAMKVTDGSVDGVWLDGANISGGGGGGGDLKTANVTVINNMTNDAIQMNDTYVVDEETGINSVSNLVYDGASGIWKIIVYKDMPTGGQLSVPTATYTVTGSIVDDGDGYVYVSGDGTITIS